MVFKTSGGNTSCLVKHLKRLKSEGVSNHVHNLQSVFPSCIIIKYTLPFSLGRITISLELPLPMGNQLFTIG